MLEESISCSPGNNGKKSRSRRFHKNAKKKTTIADINLPKDISGLGALYEESTNSTTHFEYFNPFENEILLAAADRTEASTSRNNLKNFASKGFVRLDESLPIKEENKTFPMNPPERPPLIHSVITPRSPHVLGPETQFGITESEFVRFCDDAESDVLTSDVKNQTIPDMIKKDYNVKNEVGKKQITKSKSIVEEILTDFCGSPTESEIEQTPPNSPPAKNLKGTKSIVDEILEDFCGSPYRDISPKVNSEDSTPVFRFKSQPIRTYSGLRKKKLIPRNITTDIMTFTLKDDGNTSDSSSGLSVQEDLSQSVVPQLDTVDLNNSVKLCENLHNLSSYFSQLTSTSSKESTPPPVVEKSKDERLSAIVEQIIKMKSKSLRISWNINEEKCLGFSDYENDSKESTLQELLEDEDDVLQQINCDFLCYEKVEPKVSITHLDRDIEMTLQNASDVIEKAKALICSELDTNQEETHLRYKNQPDYDIKKDIEKKSLLNSPLKDEQLFDDIDIWNDNECLLNYKTQKTLSKRAKESKDKDPCSSVSLNLSSKRSTKNEINEPNETNLNERAQIPKTHSFPGTSIHFPYEQGIENKNVPDIEFINKPPASYFVGFATVSKKPILISDIARQKANEFLKNFEQQESDERMTLNNNEVPKEDIKTNKRNISTKTPKNNENYIKPARNTSPSFVEEFSTTSKMLISLPKQNDVEIMKLNESEKCKVTIGENGFKENKVHKAQCDISRPTKNTLNNNFSVGFSTASKKIISISTKAKQKADELLKQFEQDEQEKRVLDTTFVTAGKSNGNNEKEKNSPQKTVEGNSTTTCGFVGFSTASEKPIAISLDAKRKADEILKKFEQIEEDKLDMAVEEKLTQRHPNEISEEVRRKAQELLLDIEFFEEAFEDELKKIEGGPLSQLPTDKRTTSQDIAMCLSDKVVSQATKEHIVGGFKTASKKSIHISEEASRRAETFLKGVYDEDLPQEFLKCIETDINDTNINGNNPIGKLDDKIEQVDGAIKSPRHLLYGLEHMHASKELEIKNKCSSLVSEDKIIDHRTSGPAFEALHEKKKDYIKDTHLHSPEYKNVRYIKRKRSEGNELEKSCCDVTPRRLSCGERTPLNRIENGLLCKSSSLPLKECTPNSSLITRKNLLSLSKRRKIDSLGQISESKNGPKTPEKEKTNVTHCNANSTPNLKDFFETVSTSTPRLIRNDPTNRNKQNSKDTNDSDFRPIQWEDPNNSFRINRTGCVDDVNVTFSEISPSPKQRIERLKMYGEPPPISPILMINKCRTSGLRRGRSSMKP